MGNIRSSKKVKLPLLTVLKVNTNLKTWNQYQVTVLAKKKDLVQIPSHSLWALMLVK